MSDQQSPYEPSRALVNRAKATTGSTKPKTRWTQSEAAAIRCSISCQIGRNALDGKKEPPNDISRLEYAIYNLLHAVEDLSKQIQHTKDTQ